MIHTKRVIFMILPLLFVPLVYGLSSTPDACAVPPDNRWFSGNCSGTKTKQTCCWREPIPGSILGQKYCQTCEQDPRDGIEGWNCGPKEKSITATEPGVLQNLPTLEQVPTTPPPLFGRNDATFPPTGDITGEQPPTPTPPPLFGQIAPEGPTLAGEGENIQPWNTTFPTPQPFPPPTPGFKAPQTSIDISPDLAPEEEDDQDETDDGRNDIVPDTGITEQPETQQPEDDGQEDSSEGAETAGPLT
jgi:hypothetical protein